MRLRTSGPTTPVHPHPASEHIRAVCLLSPQGVRLLRRKELCCREQRHGGLLPFLVRASSPRIWNSLLFQNGSCHVAEGLTRTDGRPPQT